MPFLRGGGSTRFRSANPVRSGRQAALVADLAALMDALGLKTAAGEIKLQIPAPGQLLPVVLIPGRQNTRQRINQPRSHVSQGLSPI